jgi:hypothetical protein
MDKTPRIVTIIGLVFEGIGVLGLSFSAAIFLSFESIPFYDNIINSMNQQEVSEMLDIMNLLGNVFFYLALIVGAFFLVNLYLFIRLIKGTVEEEDAKKIYLYQAIWGGFNMLFNQITGVLYLVSGVMGYNGNKEETNIREGI